MEDEAAQAKSEGQHIHGVFHTRHVHTSCMWGGGVTLRWHTHVSPDHSIWEGYAKMKAEPCKIVENTQEASRTQEKTLEDEAAQVKSEGQNIHGVFQYKTGAYFLQVGCVTLRWHTMVSTDAGDSGTSFKYIVLVSLVRLCWHTETGGVRVCHHNAHVSLRGMNASWMA